MPEWRNLPEGCGLRVPPALYRTSVRGVRVRTCHYHALAGRSHTLGCRANGSGLGCHDNADLHGVRGAAVRPEAEGSRAPGLGHQEQPVRLPERQPHLGHAAEKQQQEAGSGGGLSQRKAELQTHQLPQGLQAPDGLQGRAVERRQTASQ